jgi:hypothetical protein
MQRSETVVATNPLAGRTGAGRQQAGRTAARPTMGGVEPVAGVVAEFEQKGRHGWHDRVLLLSVEGGVKSRALITFRGHLKLAERGCDFRGGGHDVLVVGDELRAGLLGGGDVRGVVGCQPGGGPSGDAQ